MSAFVTYVDLLDAYEWVSSAGPFENEAYVNRTTGKIHWSSSVADLDEMLPDDIGDGSIYVALPHKNDLDLGRSLALRFIEEQLPEQYETVQGFFRKSGAYSRFKSLLERSGRLEAWYQYEASAVEQALREWSAENGLQLQPSFPDV